jgi:hypothetical protein
MTIKFFKKKTGKSEKLVISTREVLALHGITDKKTQDIVAHCFFKANAEVMKAVLKKNSIDTTIQKEVDVMRKALIVTGITDSETQDAIILKYYETILEIAGAKL